MSEISFPADASAAPKPALRWRLARVLAMLASGMLLALVIALIGWRVFAPAPLPPPQPAVDTEPVRTIAAARLFGAAGEATAQAPQAATDARLMGIFANPNGKGHALFRLAQGPVLAAAGEDVAPGLHLDAVYADRIVVLDAGVRREILLRGPPSANAAARGNPGAAAAKPLAVATSADAKAANCRAPNGFKGQLYRLKSELLDGMMNAPATWKNLLQPGPGALVVRDQSGFAEMLGLKNGDRVERANGIALAIPDDIAGAVLQPLTRNLPVYVTGMREGQPRQWLYVNAGACPA